MLTNITDAHKVDDDDDDDDDEYYANLRMLKDSIVASSASTDVSNETLTKIVGLLPPDSVISHVPRVRARERG